MGLWVHMTRREVEYDSESGFYEPKYIFYDDRYDSGCDTVSELYHESLKEWGRCEAKIKFDDRDGKARHIGWIFLKRESYRDTDETFVAETWISLLKEGMVAGLVPMYLDDKKGKK